MMPNQGSVSRDQGKVLFGNVTSNKTERPSRPESTKKGWIQAGGFQYHHLGKERREEQGLPLIRRISTCCCFNILGEFSDYVAGRVVITGPEGDGRLRQVGSLHILTSTGVTPKLSRREPNHLSEMRWLGAWTRVRIFFIGAFYPAFNHFLNAALAGRHVLSVWIVLRMPPITGVS